MAGGLEAAACLLPLRARISGELGARGRCEWGKPGPRSTSWPWGICPGCGAQALLGQEKALPRQMLENDWVPWELSWRESEQRSSWERGRRGTPWACILDVIQNRRKAYPCYTQRLLNEETKTHVKGKVLASEKLQVIMPGLPLSLHPWSSLFVGLGDKHGWYAGGWHS